MMVDLSIPIKCKKKTILSSFTLESKDWLFLAA